MNEIKQLLCLASLLVTAAVASGCSTSAARSEAPAGGAAAPAAGATRSAPIEAKAQAPVNVTLQAAGTTGKVTLTLRAEATSDLPRAVARIVVPSNVTVLEGLKEVDFGAVPAGEVRELRLVVEVPSSGAFSFFAGVDDHVSSGVLLHKAADPLRLGH